MTRRSLAPSAHLFGLTFVGLAVAALVYDGAAWQQVVLPVAVAVAVAVTVLLVVTRTTRFRFQLILLGWIVSAFAAAAFAQPGGVEPVVALLLYPALIIWGSAFFDIRPETFRGDERYRRGGTTDQ